MTGSRYHPDGSHDIAGMPGRTSRGGSGYLGASKDGVPGGSRQSIFTKLSYPVIEEMAKDSKLSLAQCEEALRAFGRAAHRFVTSGKLVGIPYMGVLYAQRRRRRIFTKHLSDALERKGLHDKALALKQKDYECINRNVVVFSTTRIMSRYFDDYAIPIGFWREYVKRELPEICRRRADRPRRRRQAAAPAQEDKEAQDG